MKALKIMVASLVLVGVGMAFGTQVTNTPSFTSFVFNVASNASEKALIEFAQSTAPTTMTLSVTNIAPAQVLVEVSSLNDYVIVNRNKKYVQNTYSLNATNLLTLTQPEKVAVRVYATNSNVSIINYLKVDFN